MKYHYIEPLKIGDVVSSKELAASIDSLGDGQHVEVHVGNHFAAIMAVWRMADEEQSPELEANIEEIVRRVNDYDKLVAKVQWLVESCDCTKLTNEFIRKHFEGCL